MHVEDGDRFPIINVAALEDAPPLNDAVRGKMVVLNFWASWCAPCRKEMPSLQRLSEKLDPALYQVLGVSVDDDENLVREFLLQHGIQFPNYLDSDMSMARKAIGVNAYPETLLIAPDGTIVRRISGEQIWDSSGMLAVLEDVRAGTTGAGRSWDYADDR